MKGERIEEGEKKELKKEKTMEVKKIAKKQNIWDKEEKTVKF